MKQLASTSNSRCEQYLAVHSNDCRLKCSNSSCVDYNTTKDFADYLPNAKCLNRGKCHQWVCQYPVGGETKCQYNGKCHSWACQYQVCYQRNCMYFGTAHAGLCRCGYQYCIYRGNSHSGGYVVICGNLRRCRYCSPYHPYPCVF